MSAAADGFVDFKSLELGRKPNQCLMAPPGHCLKAEPHLASPTLPYSAAELHAKVCAHAKAKRWKEMRTEDDALRLRGVSVTRLLRFKDDIDVEVLEAAGDAGGARSTLAVYSRSRVGYGDMGANRKRVLALLKKLGASAS